MVLRPLLASGAEPEDILAVYGLPHAHVSLPLAVRIDPPVALSCTRQSRKLLNIAGGDYSAVVAGGAIMGFAELTPEQQADPRTFTIVFRGQQHWSFLSGDRVLMDVQFGTPHLRKPLATEEEFVGRIRPLFPSISEAAIRRLHSLALEAGRMEHGTVLVVCANAAEEAQRLATQSTLIDPVQLTPRSFRSVSAIDGAVLTDFEGVCYAIGVILDGRAVHGQGDPSRGARYNSAVRYVGSNSSPTLAIVASVDGGIDLIAPETIEN